MEQSPQHTGALVRLIGSEAVALRERRSETGLEVHTHIENADLEVWEHHIESTIDSNGEIPRREREALIVGPKRTRFSLSSE